MAKNLRELQPLFDAVLSGAADADEVRRLDEILEHDEEAVELFVSYTQQDVDLRHLLKTACIHPSVSNAHAKSVSARQTRRQSASKSARWVAALLTSAAAIMVSAGVLYWLAGSSLSPTPVAAVLEKPTEIIDVFLRKPPAPVAVLTSEQNAVWQGPKIFTGQSLREGDALTLVKGDVRISMGFGAEIAAKGPCALRLVSRDRVQLQFGEVAVHVADWAHGFTVETPAMDVIDLGTTFVVSASPDASAETSVIKGQVRVSPRQSAEGNPRSVLVSEGEAFAIQKDGQHASAPSARRNDLSYIDFGLDQPFRPVGLHNTGYSFAVGDEDPYWRIIKGPDATFKGEQFARVCVPEPKYLANEPTSSQWVSMENWRTATANSTFTFQTKFDLTGFDLTTVQLFGRILADNGIAEVRVNGKTVILESWIDNDPGQQFAHPQFRTVNVSQGLVKGINTVEIDVRNGGMHPNRYANVDNPMAIRVEWEGFGRPVTPPPGRVGTRKSNQHSDATGTVALVDPRAEANVRTLQRSTAGE